MLQPEDLPPKHEDLPPKYEDLTTEYEEFETPDYNILEEDRINELLDKLEIPNYDTVELQLNQEGMINKLKQTFLREKIDQAAKKRQQLSGYSMNITKKLKQGSISQAEAPYHRKVIGDTRQILTDYIDFHQNRLKNIKGSGLKRKTKRGGKFMFFNDPTEVVKKIRTHHRINGCW